MISPSTSARKIMDVADIIATVRYLNEAIFMAAEHPTVTPDATNALQSISEEIENKLLVIGERLDEIREALA